MRPTAYIFHTRTVDLKVNKPTYHKHQVSRKYVHNSTRYILVDSACPGL